MSVRTLPIALPARLPALFLANGVTVSTLYWAQSLVGRVQAEFGPSAVASVMPGVALAGYALGVAFLASIAGDLTSPRGLLRHLMLLVGGLCAAAAAPTPVVATLACGLIGIGCSLTQRILACATDIVGPEKRAQTIGFVISSGLAGIVVARAVVPVASDLVGWRTMFTISACLATVCGLRATMVCARGWSAQAWRGPTTLPTAASLWRDLRVLRRASSHQAIVFAAFSFGWGVFPRVLAGQGGPVALSAGVVAGMGAMSALLAGKVCSARPPAKVAQFGFVLVSIGVSSLLLSQHVLLTSAAMALLEVGTQLALVANQARAQAAAPTSAVRGRITAIVTTVGFAGGAIGAALGNLV